ncbi:hypothetical protein L3Q72_18340 [Vibrio sp. JC009]|uniref:hypothetical protein n=1 Tax=Vibrio sp. JC009 TaxID=2912314 RepID=UPI0023B1EFEA|nr:hypothetical protein [Vibrio sp. JC009]WED24834.1 hypothetical protein L3Q72_18340 [Vibrio sp. JC009]
MMKLEEIVQIIELTDTDSFSEAIETFNCEGIIPDSALPFMNVVFDKAPAQLCAKLTDAGFKGEPVVVKSEKPTVTASYVVYDSLRYNLSDLKDFV